MLTARPILQASGLPLRQFIKLVRASSATVYRYLDEPMPLRLVDEWCVRIGYHPAEMYGFDAWAEVPHDA